MWSSVGRSAMFVYTFKSTLYFMNEQRICVLINVVHLKIHWPMIFLNSRGPQSRLKQKKNSFLIVPKINGRPKMLIWKSKRPESFPWEWDRDVERLFCGNDEMRPEALMWGKSNILIYMYMFTLCHKQRSKSAHLYSYLLLFFYYDIFR